ncbi:hypothetical protein CDES_00940 [Corynebacterium deserti GIMN1.010]|uniref:Maltokinase N-terminal cap domain-containing protein n=1 Tax=Corynebacterium deserti GIMN1.010 TaxID=931089 RepID=A0A0M5ITK7_9CORY|nr:hypothetical protein [Corynebacterium deserti]ALC04668.1 hypothetical protein CDES_00940 [Corynebacterium deserti GIMN1.010]
MSGTAIMYDTTVVPSKHDIAQAWTGFVDIQGSYRLVDTVDGEVGIEVLISKDRDGRLIQIPFSYRSEEINPEQTLSTLEHGVLGTRWVINALGDPVAVREFIRTIVTGDDGATRDDGVAGFLSIHGTGTLESVDLDNVTLTEVTRQRTVGSVMINGERKQFILRLPHLLRSFRKTATGHVATQLRLVSPHPENEDQELLVAEFNWLE